MLRRAIVGVVLFGACGPAQPPDTPEAHEAVAVCAAEASPAVLAKRVPHERFRDAFAAASRKAVFPAMKLLTGRYGELDLAEHAAQLRAAAAAVGVDQCRLADELQKVVEAGPSPADCDGLVKVIEAVATVSPEYLEQIIAAGCSELAGCARECVPGLALFGEVGSEHRAPALARGCAAFRADMSKGPGAFARARLGAFADACAPTLGAEAGRVAEQRRNIGL